MSNRKKRLSKGIESLKKQVKLHEEKLKKSGEEGLEDLERYYIKEIDAKKRALERKKELLEKL